MKKKIIDWLKKLPKDKMPPSGVYVELVNLTGLRKCWACSEWLSYLE